MYIYVCVRVRVCILCKQDVYTTARAATVRYLYIQRIYYIRTDGRRCLTCDIHLGDDVGRKRSRHVAVIKCSTDSSARRPGKSARA